jgi:hypothetical protein
MLHTQTVTNVVHHSAISAILAACLSKKARPGLTRSSVEVVVAVSWNIEMVRQSSFAGIGRLFPVDVTHCDCSYLLNWYIQVFENVPLN